MTVMGTLWWTQVIILLSSVRPQRRRWSDLHGSSVERMTTISTWTKLYRSNSAMEHELRQRILWWWQTHRDTRQGEQYAALWTYLVGRRHDFSSAEELLLKTLLLCGLRNNRSEGLCFSSFHSALPGTRQALRLKRSRYCKQQKNWFNSCLRNSMQGYFAMLK